MIQAFDFKRHQREFVLGGIFLAILIAFLYFQGGWFSGVGAEDPALAGGPPPGVAEMISRLSSVEVPSVMLARLEDERAHYDPSQRNIFQYGNVPKPGPSPEEMAQVQQARQAAQEARQAAIAEQEKRAQERREQMQPPPPPPGPALPTPPAITLRYSGYLGASRDRIAVLYKGDDLILARVGDTLDDKFRLLDIGYDWVKVGYVDPVFENDFQKLRMGP